MGKEIKHFYEFGPFRLDPVMRLLVRDQQGVPLTPKAFDTLLALVQNSGRVLEKDELMKMLWPDSFVEEANLAQNISVLRKALGEHPSEHLYIVTVPGRGYRFAAPVRELQAPASDVVLEGHARSRVTIEEVEEEPEGEQEHPGPPGAPPPALRAEPQLLLPAPPRGPTSRARWRLVLAGGVLAALVALLVGLNVGSWRERLLGPSTRGRIQSVVVLPLENLSHDPEQEYFADGMTDQLITNLAKIGALRVISRTSAMRYKGTRKRLPEIGRELQVDAVVEGTVVRSGNRVRITAQLVQVATDRHLWAESYEGDLGDILALQSQVARNIAERIRITLTPRDQASLARARPVNPEAYQAYLKGRFFWSKRTGEGYKKAIEYFQQAIEKDASYARAYAGLADAYLLLGGYGVAPQAQTIPKAKAAARKALEIDEELAEAHTSLGLIAGNYDWDWAEAERQYKRAIELNPNYATAHHWYGEGYLALVGRFEEAIAEMEKAQALDPLSAIISTDAGAVFYLARQYDRSIEQLRKTLEMDPNFTLARMWLALAQGQKGMFREAIAELETVRRSDETQWAWITGYLYGVSGKRDEARKMLEELKRLATKTYVDPHWFALIYIGLGEKDRAFEWLGREYDARSTGLTSLKVNVAYDSLRSDPRFADLVRRIGLPP